jgi:hypothetical protein
MWGEGRTIRVLSGAAEAGRELKQMLRVNYGRPETWSFLLGLNVVDMKGTDFTVGVGRSILQIPFWHTFTSTNVARGLVLWTNTVGNRVSYNGLTGVYTTDSHVDSIIAQDIQLSASVGFGGGTTDYADVVVHAYFAPKTHVRPEWFIKHFPGSEHKGT